MSRPCVLVFAGSDPSGGAGIQADIEAISAMGAHALPVITALTVQDNDHVFAVHPVATDLIRQQATALTDKITVAAVKVGIVGNRDNVEMIAALIGALKRQYPRLPVVLDPVLASGHGDPLAIDDAIAGMTPLMQCATLITPNMPEAVALCRGQRDAVLQAETLVQAGCQHVLITGGHGEGDTVVNRWFSAGRSRTWYWPRLAGAFHGSGCTLASAIAALLAMGNTMEAAMDLGQLYCQKTLDASYAIADGQRIPHRSDVFFKETV